MRPHEALPDRLAVAIGFVALITVAGPLRSGPPTVTVWNCGVRQIRPAGFTIACGDGNDYLKSLHWTVWSDRLAKGSGIEDVNDCTPYCAAGKFHSYPVTVTLDRVESNRFTRLRLHYSRGRPANTPQDVSRTLP